MQDSIILNNDDPIYDMCYCCAGYINPDHGIIISPGCDGKVATVFYWDCYNCSTRFLKIFKSNEIKTTSSWTNCFQKKT